MLPYRAKQEKLMWASYFQSLMFSHCLLNPLKLVPLFIISSCLIGLLEKTSVDIINSKIISYWTLFENAKARSALPQLVDMCSSRQMFF